MRLLGRMAGLATMALGASTAWGQVDLPRVVPPADLARGVGVPSRPSTAEVASPATGAEVTPVLPPVVEAGGDELPLILPPLPSSAEPAVSSPRVLPPVSSGMAGVQNAPEIPLIVPPAHSMTGGMDGDGLSALPSGPVLDRREGRPGSAERGLNERQVSKPRAPTPPPPRRGLFAGLFGGGLFRGNRSAAGQGAAPPRQNMPAEGAARSNPGAVIESTPRKPMTEDELREETLRQTIRKQVIQVAGDRIRSLEVKVSGKRVHIRAQSTRFYLRRGVQRAIEGLPSLRGYQATIDVY